MQPLKTGIAYHGNRFLSHAREDLRDIARSEFDIVVHMFSHNDWERHTSVMQDMFKMTEDFGMEVWVDNWGLGGAPGDKSHFLAYHPEAHTYYGDGIMHPYQACLNAPSYRQFVKDWLHKVVEIGGKTIFWDEPFIPQTKIEGSEDYYASCTCPTCRRMFEERFGRRMPFVMDKDVAKFRNDTLIDFHEFISEYAHSLGLKSVICLMPYQLAGLNQHTEQERMLAMDIDSICSMKHIDNVGTDPYTHGKGIEYTYDYVYRSTKTCVDIANAHGKDHNIWIQAYNHRVGTEEEIVAALEAAYDGGARNIFAWSYMSGDPNSYRAESPDRAWAKALAGFHRIREMDRDRMLEDLRRMQREK